MRSKALNTMRLGALAATIITVAMPGATTFRITTVTGGVIAPGATPRTATCAPMGGS